MHADAKHAAEERTLQGILHRDALVGEQAYLVVEQLNAGSVESVQEAERGVGADEHRPRVVLEACKLHRVGRRYVEFLLLAHGCRIEIRLHVEIMAECHVILRHGRTHSHGKQNQCYV